MTLLKFVAALLSTMVVAVDLSSKPANSLAFAQLDQNSAEEDFRNKVVVFKNQLDELESAF